MSRRRVEYFEIEKKKRYGIDIYELLLMLEGNYHRLYTFHGINGVNLKLLKWRLPCFSEKELKDAGNIIKYKVE